MVEITQEQWDDLNREIKTMKHEMERLQDVHEIQNLVGKYANLHTDLDIWKTPQLFALKQHDVSVEIAMLGKKVGVYEIRKEYKDLPENKENPPKPGFFTEHHWTTPVIQVAADGKTAKGLWWSPGHETYRGEGAHDPNDKIRAHWCYGKYGCDFIKEDGEWKIWHLHWYDTFMCDFYKSWIDQPQPPRDVPVDTPVHKTIGPVTSRSTYFPDEIRGAVPPYPEPYESWDGKSVA